MELRGESADPAVVAHPDGAGVESSLLVSPTSDTAALAVGAPGGSGSYTALRVALTFMRIGPGLMLLVLVLAMKFLSVKFLTSGNIGNVLDQTATIALLSI